MADLGAWERKAINRLRSHSTAVVSFVSDHIAAHERALLGELLPDAHTPDEIKRAFKSLQRGIYLCRHGETDLGATGHNQGWLDDPLNKDGKQQVKLLGEWLIGRNVEQVRSSDLKRARQTSKAVCKTLEIDLYESSFVYRDWTLGTLDGRPRKDVAELIQNYVNTVPDTAPDGGESFNKFKNRVLPAIQALMDVVLDPNSPGFVISLCCHSSVQRAVAAWVQSGANGELDFDTDTFFSLDIAPASVIWLVPTAKGWKWQYIDVISEMGGEAAVSTGQIKGTK